MTQILTFLGKGGTGRTKIAIATAKKLASEGKRVLLVGQNNAPAFSLWLGVTSTPDPQAVDTNLQVVQLQSSVLLERSWEEAKKLEAQYLRTPILKEVYGQELSVLPGMDSALALNALREYNDSGNYDVIIYDGSGDTSTLRMFGMAETLGWYIRRFSKLLADSDLGRTVSPFLQPLLSTVMNVSWTSDALTQPTNKVNNLLDEGRAALADPNRVAAYLVTTDDPVAIATARYLWGSAQQIGLTVAGVILNQSAMNDVVAEEFAPLSVNPVPQASPDDWQALIAALPDFTQPIHAPKPMEVDISALEIRLFLPGFDKKQVKLTQSGPEITIEAGDQRRNILLPPALTGRSIKGAKFQNSYLTMSF